MISAEVNRYGQSHRLWPDRAGPAGKIPIALSLALLWDSGEPKGEPMTSDPGLYQAATSYCRLAEAARQATFSTIGRHSKVSPKQ
jgi:hypothetical protein